MDIERLERRWEVEAEARNAAQLVLSSVASPIQPRPGSVKAAVLNLMLGMPDGICRRDAASMIDVYELSNRIGELQADGWIIHKSRCEKHHHRQRFTLYSI